MNQTNGKSEVALGAEVRTWRARIGVGADFPLHAPTDVERAMEAEIAELRACIERVATPAALADMLAQYRNGDRALPTYGELAALAGLVQGSPAVDHESEQVGRFDRVQRQGDGSFQHFYQGKPVAGPGRAEFKQVMP